RRAGHIGVSRRIDRNSLPEFEPAPTEVGRVRQAISRGGEFSDNGVVIIVPRVGLESALGWIVGGIRVAADKRVTGAIYGDRVGKVFLLAAEVGGKLDGSSVRRELGDECVGVLVAGVGLERVLSGEVRRKCF